MPELHQPFTEERLDEYMDTELIERLQRVEERLDDIARNTRTTWYELLLSGFLRGVGLVLASALTLTLSGWALSLLGVAPGAEEIAEFLTDVIENTNQ